MTALRELHPECKRTMPCSEEPSAPPLQFTSDQVIQAVKSFQAGTAPGPSGLRAQHLKDLTSGRNMAPHIAANVIKALTKVVNLFASGKAASGAAEYCAGANLFAANKKDGGIRPIAVGDLMRRLVSKCFAYSLSDKAAELFAPLQLGTGVRGDCKAIVNTERSIIEDPHVPPQNKWLHQVNLKMVFHTPDGKVGFEKTFPRSF